MRDEVVIRSRTDDDLVALGRLLLDQQPETRYPYRDPLPMPVEQFLHGHDAERAWVAEAAGRPVGHVCRVAHSRTAGSMQPLDAICATAHGCDVDDLAWISALFVSSELRGSGVGARLLDAVVDDAVREGRRPCLEVLPVHPAAMALYVSRGWRVVHELRPDWLDAGAEHHHVVQAMVLDPQPDRGGAQRRADLGEVGAPLERVGQEAAWALSARARSSRPSET